MQERPHSSPEPPGQTPGLRYHCAGAEPRWLWRRVREYQRPNEEHRATIGILRAPLAAAVLSSAADTTECKRNARRGAGRLHLIPNR